MKIGIHEIARVAHEVNRAYCATIGDNSHAPWDESPAELKESVFAGVRKVLDREVGTPEESHQAWCDYKSAEGWVHGEVKDFDAKTHPCLLPYDQLPVEDRLKDVFFRAIVEALR